MESIQFRDIKQAYWNAINGVNRCIPWRIDRGPQKPISSVLVPVCHNLNLVKVCHSRHDLVRVELSPADSRGIASYRIQDSHECLSR